MSHTELLFVTKVLRRHLKPFQQKVLASQFALKVEADKQLAMAYGGRCSKLLFSELADNYINYEFKGGRPKQQRNRLKFWVNIFGNKRVLDIARRDISNGPTSLLKRGG